MKSHPNRMQTRRIRQHHILPLLLLVAAALAVLAFVIIQSGKEKSAPYATNMGAASPTQSSTTASTVLNAGSTAKQAPAAQAAQAAKALTRAQPPAPPYAKA